MTAPTTVCPHCRAGLVNIVSGAVCPKGCWVDLQPKLSPEVNRANVRAYQIAQLPATTALTGVRVPKGTFADCRLYVIDGHSTVYRRIVKKKHSLTKVSCTGNRLARLGDRAVELTPLLPIDGFELSVSQPAAG